MRFKAGTHVSNWRLGGDDIAFKIMGVDHVNRKYLLKVERSPEATLGEQYWGYSDTIDLCHDSLEDIEAWKKELDL